jgi:dihydroflavonol-4-reductase
LPLSNFVTIFENMILVTGGTGLTGAHVLLHLLEIHPENVRAIYRDEKSILKTKSLFSHHHKNELFEKIEWIQGGLLDIPALQKAFLGIDYVYHCAAVISFDPNDEELIRKTNIEGTANIVNCCLAYNIKKLCHVSSMAALGDLKESQQNTVIDEETEWNPEKPHSDYAISKYGGEMEIWRGQQEGLNVVVVNPGIIIGPPLWETGSSKLFSLVASGHPFYTYGTMGFVSVTDVAAIMVLLMNSDISGERFILSSETLSYKEVFFMVADAMKKKRAHIYAKPWMTSIGWKIDWLLSAISGHKRMISKDDSKTLHSKAVYSNKKIKNALNYEFEKIFDAIAEAVRIKNS